MAIALALGTTLCYGVANFLGPVVSRRMPIIWFMLVSSFAGMVAVGALALATGAAAPGGAGLAWGLSAGALNVLALGAFYRATNLGAISIAAPLGATGAIVPVVVGLASGEAPGALQLAGIPVALAGVMLAAGGGRGRPEGGTEEEAAGHAADRAVARRSALWALCSAVLFGVYLTMFAEASEHGSVWATLDTRIAMVVVLAGAVLATGAARATAPGEVPAIALPGLLLVAGTVLFAEATTRGLLSIVSVIATLFPVVTVTLALLALDERLDGRQRIGVLLALAGVAAIAAG
jgi:drug/metabolite transporter (DMT)-like permease